MSAGLADTTFVLSEDPRLVVVVRLKKVEGAAAEIYASVEGSDTFVLTFTNPNTLNFGPADPIDVGALNGQPLTTSLRVNVFGDYSSYEVMYTFYLGEGAAA